MKIQIQIDEDELDELVLYASARGFVRIDPRKAWTLEERKQAARYAIGLMMMRQFCKERP